MALEVCESCPWPFMGWLPAGRGGKGNRGPRFLFKRGMRKRLPPLKVPSFGEWEWYSP